MESHEEDITASTIGNNSPLNSIDVHSLEVVNSKDTNLSLVKVQAAATDNHTPALEDSVTKEGESSVTSPIQINVQVFEDEKQ